MLKKAVHLDPYKRYEEVSEFTYALRHPNPPVYIARQLYSFKNGLRTGGYMKEITSGLNDDDITAAAAYIGSLDP